MFGYSFFRIPGCDPIHNEGPQKPESKGSEPRDNDGRDTCWWCNAQTETKMLFTSVYQICLECDK